VPEIKSCRIDATLTQSVDEAIANFDLEQKYEVCTIDASKKLAAAQAAWAEHKMTCKLCYGSPANAKVAEMLRKRV
jgi:hypothetical protein